MSNFRRSSQARKTTLNIHMHFWAFLNVHSFFFSFYLGCFFFHLGCNKQNLTVNSWWILTFTPVKTNMWPPNENPACTLPYLITPVLNHYITEGVRLVGKILISSSLFDSPKPHWTSIEPVYHRGNKDSGDISHQFELVRLSPTLLSLLYQTIFNCKVG